MIRSHLGYDAVPGMGPKASLDHLLEHALVIGKTLIEQNRARVTQEIPPGETPRRVQTGVQVDGADDGLKRVGEYGRAAPAPGLPLRLAQQHELPETHPLRTLGQNLAGDEKPLLLREVSFAIVGKGGIEELDHGEFQDRVPQKLDPLVGERGVSPVAAQVRPVRQRLPQQVLVTELQVDAILEPVQHGADPGIRTPAKPRPPPQETPPPTHRPSPAEPAAGVSEPPGSPQLPAGYRRTARETLCPPKPNELLSASRTWAGRAFSGT